MFQQEGVHLNESEDIKKTVIIIVRSNEELYMKIFIR